MNKKAFTLVELIVVIIILAILGTIAFISFQGYSATARDSVRIGDMGKINSSLELFHLDAGKYPETTDGYTITYTGSEVWTQGKFGETTFNNVEKLDKIPTDPLTGVEYIYSVTNNRQEYQVAGITENGEYTLNNVDNSYAEGKTAILKIDGNYNGRLIKVKNPGVTYILAVPSIITSTGATLEEIIRDKMLAYNGFKNLPFNYTGGGYDIIGENSPLTVVNESDYEVFSGSVESFEDDTNLQVQFIQNLQAAYSGTDIETEPSINEVVTLVGGEEFLAQSILNNSVNNKVDIVSTPSIGSSITYECNGLNGNPNPNQWGDNEGYSDFDLCAGTKVLNSLSNISTSSVLTNNSGGREVYAFILQAGIEYQIETLGDDEGSDTAIFLYDNQGGEYLVMNDDLDEELDIYRSRVIFTPSTTGYYFLGVMGYEDGGTYADYTLSVSSNTSLTACVDSETPSPESWFTFDEETKTISYIDGLNGVDLIIPCEYNGIPVENIAGILQEDKSSISSYFNRVVIPDGVKTIGDYAFSQRGITSLDLGEGVTSIGYSTFSENSISSVIIPDSVTSIGEESFYEAGIETLVIGNGLEVVSFAAFWGNNISNLTLGNNITFIDMYAFWYNNISDLILPDSLVDVGSRPFEGNPISNVVVGSNLENYSLGFTWNTIDTVTNYDGISSTEYVYGPSGSGGIIIYGYLGSDTDVIIPSSINGKNVDEIGFMSFSNLSDITSVTIPEGISKIAYSAFSGTSLTSLVLPESLTEIGRYAFFDNDLTSIEIPSGVTSIRQSAFYKNYLTSGNIIVKCPLPSFGIWVFYNNGASQSTNIVNPTTCTP